MHSSPAISFSPSFNSYSSSRLEDVAARVIEELRHESELEFDDDFGLGNCENQNDRALEKPQVEEANNCEEDENDEFEFPCVSIEPNPAISADEIFYQGQIKPVFPVFGRDLLFAGVENSIGEADCSKPPIPPPPSIRLPLGRLMREDRDPPSCSSSESDDLDGVPAESYCVWTPKSASAAAEEESPGRCKKSNSMGSSKRWKFRDLLRRSSSDGKDIFVFLHAKKDEKVDEKEATTEKSSGEVKVVGKVKPKKDENVDEKEATTEKSSGEVKVVGKVKPKKDENVDEKEATTEKSSGEVKIVGKLKPKVIGNGNEVVPLTAAHEANDVRKSVSAKGGDKRRSYLPYRKDFVGFFANVNGVSRNLHPF